MLYVEELIAPGVINTKPQQTLRAFADHGPIKRALGTDITTAERTLADAADAGLDLTAITAQLERAGVSAFCDSYRQLLDCIEAKLAALPAAPAGYGRRGGQAPHHHNAGQVPRQPNRQGSRRAT